MLVTFLYISHLILLYFFSLFLNSFTSLLSSIFQFFSVYKCFEFQILIFFFLISNFSISSYFAYFSLILYFPYLILCLFPEFLKLSVFQFHIFEFFKFSVCFLHILRTFRCLIVFNVFENVKFSNFFIPAYCLLHFLILSTFFHTFLQHFHFFTF